MKIFNQLNITFGICDAKPMYAKKFVAQLISSKPVEEAAAKP